MPSYRVTWEIDVDADDPLDAAKQAHAVQIADDRIADYYNLTDNKGRRFGVDLVDGTVIELFPTWR